MQNLKHWLKHLLNKNRKQITFKYINGVEWMCWECQECGMITKIKKVK